MRLVQMLADGEVQAGAAILARCRAVGLLEFLEDTAELFRGHADAGWKPAVR